MRNSSLQATQLFLQTENTSAFAIPPPSQEGPFWKSACRWFDSAPGHHKFPEIQYLGRGPPGAPPT